MSQNNLGIIDPHLHLFDLQQGNYAWLKPSQAPFWPDKNKITRNFSEQDLTLPANMHLAGFVHIEAGFDNQQPWREIDWLEIQCQLPFKSVACADLCSLHFPEVIQQLSQRCSVVGIRHILDDDAYTILTHPQINQHFELLARLGWSFDAQLGLDDNRGVAALLQLSQRFPNVAIIINHGGLPPEQINERQTWLANLQKLSEHSNMAIKLSGWEMTNRQWTSNYMQEITTLCLQLFGSERVMLASNFPLCTFSFSYAELWQRYQRELALTADIWQQLTANNARRWYQFT
jgi:predicted TIM-barrel fold metal-dependent hydrolase